MIPTTLRLDDGLEGGFDSLLGRLLLGTFGRLGFFALCRGSLGSGGLSLGREFLDTAGGVYKVLFTRVKRVANRAQFHAQILNGRTGRKDVAASAGNGRARVISRMDIDFHTRWPKVSKRWLFVQASIAPLSGNDVDVVRPYTIRCFAMAQ